MLSPHGVCGHQGGTRDQEKPLKETSAGWGLVAMATCLPKLLYAPLMSLRAGLSQGHAGSPGRACLLGLPAPGPQMLEGPEGIQLLGGQAAP